MRILFINHFPLTGSGSGVYTANLAKSLTRRGHDTAIIFSENRKEYENYDGIELYPVYFKDSENIEGSNSRILISLALRVIPEARKDF